jgi:hypothetical protein
MARGDLGRVGPPGGGHVEDAPHRPDQVDVPGILALVPGGEHQLRRPPVAEPVTVPREHVQDRALRGDALECAPQLDLRLQQLITR